jgi:uncharacterized lipoprotein NlpE involved in copper resistance
MKRTKGSWTIVAVTAALLGMAGCETAPETSGVLDAARSAVSAAETDPNVSKYAPTELDRARKLLVNAEGAAKEKGAKDKTYCSLCVPRHADGSHLATARAGAGGHGACEGR